MVTYSLKTEKILRGWIMAIIAAFVAAFCAVNFLGFDLLTDDYMQSDMQLAKMMWEQKTLLPQGWVFGDVIHTVTPTVLCAVLYGITRSINLSMALAMGVFILVLMFVVYWILMPFAGRTRRLLAIMALFGFVICYDPAQQFLFYFSGFFISSLITMLVVWGDYLRNYKNIQDSIITPGFIAANALAFLTGMQSPLQTVLMIVPLWLYEIVRLIKCLIETRGKLKQIQLSYTVGVICYTVSNLFGVWVISRFDYVQTTTYLGISPVDGVGFVTRLKYLFTMIFEIFGQAGDVPVIIRILIVPLSLLGVVLVGVTLAYGITTHTHRNGVWHGVVFCCLSCVCAGLATLLFDIGSNHQLFVAWYAAVAFSAAYVVKSFGASFGKKAVAVVIAASLINFLVSYVPSAATSLKTGEYSLNRETVSTTNNYS